MFSHPEICSVEIGSSTNIKLFYHFNTWVRLGHAYDLEVLLNFQLTSLVLVCNLSLPLFSFLPLSNPLFLLSTVRPFSFSPTFKCFKRGGNYYNYQSVLQLPIRVTITNPVVYLKVCSLLVILVHTCICHFCVHSSLDFDSCFGSFSSHGLYIFIPMWVSSIYDGHLFLSSWCLMILLIFRNVFLYTCSSGLSVKYYVLGSFLNLSPEIHRNFVNIVISAQKMHPVRHISWFHVISCGKLHVFVLAHIMWYIYIAREKHGTAESTGRTLCSTAWLLICWYEYVK